MATTPSYSILVFRGGLEGGFQNDMMVWPPYTHAQQKLEKVQSHPQRPCVLLDADE